MKDRLITLALALAALAVFYVLVMPKPAAPREEVTRPLTGEAGANGYLAMHRWLEAAGIETHVLRDRYSQLHEITGADERGHLLITTAPHVYPIRYTEIEPLRDWIASGNTLLVLAGLADTPEWSMESGADGQFLNNLQYVTGLEFTSARTAERASDSAPGEEGEVVSAAAAWQPYDEPQRYELVPNGPHPLFEGVQSVLAISEYPADQWRATSANVEVVLELAQNPQSGEPVMWLARYAKGRIIVSGYGSVFTNKLLGERDNAQLLANVVRWGRDAGLVIFDDAHQGAVAFYDPAAFFSDSRLYRSLLWLLVLWLVFVLGPQRLRRRTPGWQPADTTAFVRATGGFLARVVKPAAAGRQLFANFFNDVRGRLDLPENGAPVWDWLAARSSLAPEELARLQEFHERAVHGRRLDLSELHNLLVRTRRSIV